VTGGGRVYLARGAAGIVALAETDGSVVWTADPGGDAVSTPAYDPETGSLYAACTDGRLYRLDSSNGSVLGSFNASAGISLAPCLAGDTVYVSAGNRVHALDKATLAARWSYEADSRVDTPPAYSPSRERLFVVSQDLYVHAIDASSGNRAWRVKPTPRSGGDPGDNGKGLAEALWGWPVVSEAHGYVLVRYRLDWQTLWTWSPWPTTNADIRRHLTDQPGEQCLYALDLDDGAVPFICNLGHGGWGDGGYMPMGPMPALKKLPGGGEVVWTVIRGDQTQNTDGRWDSYLGEMVLDGTTVSGVAAGEVRWMDSRNGSFFPTDEQAFVTAAGDHILAGHWMMGFARSVTDRSSSRGSYSDPIRTESLPQIVTSTRSVPFSASHYSSGPLTQDGDARTIPFGFYIYWGQGTVYDTYWSSYSCWVVSNGRIYYRSCDGAVVCLESGDPTARAGRRVVSEPALSRRPDPPRPAGRVLRPEEAAAFAGTEAAVEGTVRYVFNNGKTVLLGFQHPHQGAFKVQIPRSAWERFGPEFGRRWGRNRETLVREGLQVRVRGRIGWYQGDPAIYLERPGDLTVIDPFSVKVREGPRVP
jgi:outer membrane protein assembly factor BamB